MHIFHRSIQLLTPLPHRSTSLVSLPLPLPLLPHPPAAACLIRAQPLTHTPHIKALTRGHRIKAPAARGWPVWGLRGGRGASRRGRRTGPSTPEADRQGAGGAPVAVSPRAARLVTGPSLGGRRSRALARYTDSATVQRPDCERCQLQTRRRFILSTYASRTGRVSHVLERLPENCACLANEVQEVVCSHRLFLPISRGHHRSVLD